MPARRQFLRFLAGAAALDAAGRLAHAATPAPGARSRVRAVAFDLFTIFDPRSVVAVAESMALSHARELCETWRVRLFEYCWLRAAAGTYRDFRALAEDALDYAARAQGVTLSPDQRRELVASYERLDAWPDAHATLEAMRESGLRLATLANFSPTMIERLLAHAGLRPLFELLISTDAARTFKPDPRAYALGPRLLGLRRDQIAFAAFGGWDAAGAKWYGYPTFWVNRLGVAAERLLPGPDATGRTLTELATWVKARG